MIRRILIVTVVLAAARPASAEEFIVQAARVHTQTGAPLAPGAVRIKDGKIVEVAGSIAARPGVRVVDLGEGVLLPGFIDAHTSIGVEGGLAESTSEVTPGFRVIDAVDWSSRSFRQTRAQGVTAACLVPSSENVISGLSCVVKTDGDPARRIVKPDQALVLALSSDPTAGNNSRNRPDSIYNRQPTNRMGVVWILRSELARAQREATGARSMVREALAGTRPVICVSRTDADLGSALRLRQEYPMNMTLAGGQEAYKVSSDLAAAKVPVLLGPISTSPGPGPESTELILNLAGTLHEARVPFALTGGNLLDQARLAARFGLPREAALAAITSSPAKLLGLDQRLGAIAPGRDADLVALTGDPFDLASKIRWTMIDGVIRAEEP